MGEKERSNNIAICQQNWTVSRYLNKSPHDKTNKMACAPSKDRSAWASAHSDQSWLGPQWVAKDPSLLHAVSDDWSDWAHMPFCWFSHETAQMGIKPTAVRNPSDYKSALLTIGQGSPLFKFCGHEGSKNKRDKVVHVVSYFIILLKQSFGFTYAV